MRISTVVTAVKQYSHMDRTPFADVDVTEGLDSTATLLGHKLATIDVRRDYPDEVPVVPGHAGELNQRWTNLIDNAAHGMDGEGVLTVRPPRRRCRGRRRRR